jgi:5-methylcytosine-specific restriction protein A
MPDIPSYRPDPPVGVPAPALRRGSSAARGYGSVWQRCRRAFLRAHPICECPGCGPKCCGQRRPTTDVDHAIRVSGPDDPLFWAESNWRARCHGCHSVKTTKVDGGFGNPTC